MCRSEQANLVEALALLDLCPRAAYKNPSDASTSSRHHELSTVCAALLGWPDLPSALPEV